MVCRAQLVVATLLYGRGSESGDAHIYLHAWTDLAVDRLID